LGGLGYAQVAPGTLGTLAAVPLVVLASLGGLWVYLAVTAAVTLVGVWAAEEACRYHGVKDPQSVVIDEVAGYMVAMLVLPKDWQHMLMAFVTFRIFDILKPWPASWADRDLGGGLGVMLDDLFAGAYTGIVLWLLYRLF
jgi:phosphatidylglycerophosphatase A